MKQNGIGDKEAEPVIKGEERVTPQGSGMILPNWKIEGGEVFLTYENEIKNPQTNKVLGKRKVVDTLSRGQVKETYEALKKNLENVEKQSEGMLKFAKKVKDEIDSFSDERKKEIENFSKLVADAEKYDRLMKQSDASKNSTVNTANMKIEVKLYKDILNSNEW